MKGTATGYRADCAYNQGTGTCSYSCGHDGPQCWGRAAGLIEDAEDNDYLSIDLRIQFEETK